MRKTLALALAALAACSSSKKEKPLAYAAPIQPDAVEIGAIADAEATLAANVDFVAPTEPATGGPGLADQLVAGLGGYAVASRLQDPSSAKLAGTAVRQAFDTGGMDPACITTEQAGAVTTVSWGKAAPCTVVASDPTTSLTVGVSGWLTHDASRGETDWNVGETFEMTTTSGGTAMSMWGTAALYGSMTIGADTITISSASNADVTTSMSGMTIDEQIETTLDGSLGYQASPFCVVSGSLQLEQRVSALGQDQAQGWRFGWTGCGAYTVAHGT